MRISTVSEGEGIPACARSLMHRFTKEHIHSLKQWHLIMYYYY